MTDLLQIIREDVPAGLNALSGVLDVNGCPLHYWVAGPETGEKVVLTHANLTDHRNYNAQFQLLAQQYRVLTWDVRGHGRSRPARTPFTAEQARLDLLALLDHLGWEKAHLIGNSMGGNISQDVLFYAPERVLSLFASDCACNTLPLSRLEQLGVSLAPAIYRLYPAGLLRQQSATGTSVRPEIQAYLLDVFNGYSKLELQTLASGMNGFLHAEPGYRCPHPLAVVYGERDGLGNIRKAAPIWAERDGVTARVIPNAGHVPHLDNATEFNAVLLDFLRGATGSHSISIQT